MDEEQTSKKINIDSFFNRIDEVDEVANKALKQSSSNLSTINANKTLELKRNKNKNVLKKPSKKVKKHSPKKLFNNPFDQLKNINVK